MPTVSEALRNAFHHASAKNVHLQFRYAAEQFHLTVLDDGRGIDPSILSNAPREGHYGLAGMRKRAKVAKGDLNLSSALGLGAKIELRIPAM
jgi:signal transduction histidine kinase